MASRGITVLGAAHDGAAALELIERHAPTVAVVDTKLDTLSGLELAARVTRSASTTAFLIHADWDDRRLLGDALDAGARGFVSRDAPPRDLVRAIEMVCDGRYAVNIRLLGLLDDESEANRGGLLSSRERSVLRLSVNGVRRNDVWRDLSVSPVDVSRELARAVSKLEVRRIEIST